MGIVAGCASCDALDPVLAGLVAPISGPLILDAVRFLHLAALVLGMGAVLFTDTMIMHGLFDKVTARQIGVLHHAHAIISAGLVALWVTGLGLLYLRTGFDVSQFSPKLVAKLGTVTLLSLTAVVMARYALPFMTGMIGNRLLNLPLEDQISLSLCVAMSLCGWVTALILGSSIILKTAGWWVLGAAVALHGVAFMTAFVAAFIARKMLR
jgi:hypothetical protein